MDKVILKLIVFLMIASLSSCAAIQQPKGMHKLALVIGNSDYQIAPLKNPKNDAFDISRSLEDLGYQVTTLYDQNQKEMTRAVAEFYERSVKPDTQAIFYYAGHAVQNDGRNFLIPIGFDMDRLDQTRSWGDVSYPIDHLMKQMRQSQNDLNVVILDACRNNPFTEKNFAKHSRSIPSFVRGLKLKNGLAQIRAPSSTLIAYSTSPGDVAADGTSRNGVYTSHLLKHMKTRGITIETLFKKVRAGVIEETGNKQIPWEHSSLYKYDFQLAPPDKRAKIRSGF